MSWLPVRSGAEALPPTVWNPRVSPARQRAQQHLLELSKNKGVGRCCFGEEEESQGIAKKFHLSDVRKLICFRSNVEVVGVSAVGENHRAVEQEVYYPTLVLPLLLFSPEGTWKLGSSFLGIPDVGRNPPLPFWPPTSKTYVQEEKLWRLIYTRIYIQTLFVCVLSRLTPPPSSRWTRLLDAPLPHPTTPLLPLQDFYTQSKSLRTRF